MNLLLDTHLLIWTSTVSGRLPKTARTLIGDEGNQIFFSAASLWEIAIKTALRRPDFDVDARILRRHLLSEGYQELDVTGDHAVHVDVLPLIHRDPFDRLLVAQAMIEGLTLLTADETVARYPGSIQRV